MPLTAEQITALDALAGADPQELADAFHEKHGKAAQILNDAGDNAATKRAGSEVRKIEGTLKKEIEAREKAEAKLKEADPAKVHEQYQSEIRDLKTAHDTEVKGLKSKGTEREKARTLSELKAYLAPLLKPMALQAVINDPATAAQVEFDDDGNRTIKQRGKDIPYSPPAGKDALHLWGADLVETVKSIDADSVLVKGNTGGGSGGQGGNSAPSDAVSSYASKRFAPPATPGQKAS